MAKAAKRTKKVIEGAKAIRRINRAIDTVPELVPGVRRIAEKNTRCYIKSIDSSC